MGQGTFRTTAISPVIVALISELLHGPGVHLAERQRVPLALKVAILTAVIALVIRPSVETARRS